MPNKFEWNPYSSSSLKNDCHFERTSGWYPSLQPVVGALIGVVVVALGTVGPKAAVKMTVEFPLENFLFFGTFSMIVFLFFWIWKGIRRLVFSEVVAKPIFRVGGGFLFITSFLLGVMLLKKIGILNREQFSSIYHNSVILVYGVACLAAVVEMEQYIARRFAKPT